MVMEEDLKKLYTAVSSRFDVGEYDAFVQKMQTPDQRKAFYDVVGTKGLDLGDYDTYESRLKKKDDGEVSTPPSEPSSKAPSDSPSIEDRFPFLQGEDTITPIAEASTTRVEQPALDKDVYERGDTAKKFGLFPEEKEFTPPPAGPGLTKIQEWAGKKMEGDPELAKVIEKIHYEAPQMEQAGMELRTGLTTPGKQHPYEQIAEKSEFARTALGMLRGVNEGVANTLRTLDGAERAFWDAATGGEVKEGGWFKEAADYMDSSMKENWPEVDKNQVVGNLVYNLGHLVPFFGEMMITPKIGKIGQLENLMTTKGFAAAYGDADVRKEMGEDAKPLLEGLKGAAMGAKDAYAFHLLGYTSGKFGKVVADALKSGDAGVTANMIANGLGFGAYATLDEYLQTGEFSLEGRMGDVLLGGALAMPAMMQMMGNRIMNTYYGIHPVNLARVRQLPINVIEARDMEASLLERARGATSLREQKFLLEQAKGFHEVANIKAAEMVIMRDPQGTIKSIKENESLSEVQKEKMIRRTEEASLNAEVDAAEMEAATASEKADQPSSEGKVSPKGESPSETLKTPQQESQNIAKERLGETDKIEKAGYILNDGSMLDMSGESRMRTMDHADVKEFMSEAGVEFKDSNDAWEVKSEFMRGGAVRMNPESKGLDLSVKPTPEQNKTIERFARKFDGEVTIDVNDAQGNTMSVRYPEGTNHKKITGDIKALYEQGRIPTGKDVTVDGKIDIEGVKAEGPKPPKEREMAESIEDEFTLSEKPENIPRSKLDPPPTKKPPKGEEKAEGERPKTELELLSERVEARRIAQSSLEKGTMQKISEVFQEHIIDVNEPFKRALMKEGGEVVQKFINRMNLEAGASARARAAYDDARVRVFGKGRKVMRKNQQEFLSEITDLIRTQELDNLYKSRLEERVAQEKEKYGRELTPEEMANLEANIELENPMLKHEGKVGGKESTELLEKFRNKDPEFMKMAQEKWGIKDYDPAAMERSIGEYHKVLGEQLTELYENGIINEAAYNKLRAEQPYYSPRKYIEYMDRMDPDGSMSGIKKLEGGSEGEKVVDMNELMGDVISRTSNLVARNKTLQSGSAYATEQGSELVRNAPYSAKFREKLEAKEEGDPFMEPEFADAPRDKVAVDFYENGQKKQLWIDREMYKYFDYARPDQATTMTQYAISMSLGTPILKFFATGANPEFAVKNLLIDAMHVWMTTPEYSPIMPVGMAQIVSDYTSIAKDAWSKTGEYKDFIKEGGGMSFLTTQGTDTPFKFRRYTRTSSSLGQLRDGVSKIGEFSEAWTRLAVRRRYIDNRVKQAEAEGRTLTDAEMKSLQEDGTAAARNYLDFSQGGTTSKFLDKFIPYFGAGVQVTRGSLRAAGKNPKLFAAKLAQISALATTLSAWNMGDTGDDELAEKRRQAYLNDVSPSVKARNFIIMTNMAYTDKGGNDRMLYFKIPKDALQSSITSLIEDVYIKAAHDGAYKIMNDKMMASLNNDLRNITDLKNLPPLIKAMQGYGNNYDDFYDTEIWSGREQPEGNLSQEYYDGVTPPRYVKFGDLTGMSPVRTNYFAKQFFTEGNLWASMLGEFFDGIAVGFEGEAKDVMEKEGYEKLKGVPGLRRVLKSTYPKPAEEVEEAQLELNKVKTENDHRFNEVFGGKEVSEVDDDAVSTLLEDVFERDGVYETERLMDKVNRKMTEDGVGSAVKKLKWFSPEVRAVGFYRLLKDSPDNADELWAQAEAAGLVSDRFKQEVGRLMDMEDASPQGK